MMDSSWSELFEKIRFMRVAMYEKTSERMDELLSVAERLRNIENLNIENIEISQFYEITITKFIDDKFVGEFTIGYLEHSFILQFANFTSSSRYMQAGSKQEIKYEYRTTSTDELINELLRVWEQLP